MMIGIGMLLSALVVAPSNAGPVVMVAIDGLRPSELTSAATRAWNLPVLRGLLREGAAASGVRGVLPTLTLPSMVTLVTGTWPGVHGVVSNLRCDLQTHDDGGYFWYASDVKVETLWEAARQRGLRTANVGWTSTIGAPIDRNLPEVWHAPAEIAYDVQASHSTAGLLARLDRRPQHDSGAYYMNDDRRAAFAQTLIESYDPDLLTMFFENLDATEHATGVDTPEDRRALEHIDHLLGEVVAAARRKRRDVTIVIVSDHGFAPASTDINLVRVLHDARVCPAGGSAYLLLKDSTQLASLREGDLGVDRILHHDAIVAAGGWSAADYMVVFRPGYVASRDSSAPLRAPTRTPGMHGYWPDDPAMYSTFIIAGARVPLHGDLGTIDMRTIAPTVAKVLGTHLESAGAPSLF